MPDPQRIILQQYVPLTARTFEQATDCEIGLALARSAAETTYSYEREKWKATERRDQATYHEASQWTSKEKLQQVTERVQRYGHDNVEGYPTRSAQIVIAFRRLSTLLVWNSTVVTDSWRMRTGDRRRIRRSSYGFSTRRELASQNYELRTSGYSSDSNITKLNPRWRLLRLGRRTRRNMRPSYGCPRSSHNLH